MFRLKGKKTKSGFEIEIPLDELRELKLSFGNKTLYYKKKKFHKKLFTRRLVPANSIIHVNDAKSGYSDRKLHAHDIPDLRYNARSVAPRIVTV